MSIISTILTTLGGATTGIIQDFLHDKKEKKEKELDQKLWKERERFKLKINQKLKELEIEQENIELKKTKNEVEKSENNIKNSQEKTEQEWYNNIQKSTGFIANLHNSKLINLANFITAITRPFVTYVFLGFLFVIYFTSIKDFNEKDNIEYLKDFINSILFLTEAIIGFWFYKRSSEKLQLKKKL